MKLKRDVPISLLTLPSWDIPNLVLDSSSYMGIKLETWHSTLFESAQLPWMCVWRGQRFLKWVISRVSSLIVFLDFDLMIFVVVLSLWIRDLTDIPTLQWSSRQAFCIMLGAIYGLCPLKWGIHCYVFHIDVFMTLVFLISEWRVFALLEASTFLYKILELENFPCRSQRKHFLSCFIVLRGFTLCFCRPDYFKGA